MLNLKLLCILLLLSAFSVAQSAKTNQAPWQQRVEYVINVELDDIAHILRGNETILYTNNSPDTLTEIYIHLWPNAYKNNETAFAKQQLENGKTTFYYLPEDERGFIDSINFLVDWVSVKWEYTEQIDIAKLVLKRPIEPGGVVRIATTFKVKLPNIVSRMGHQNQLYCITQWYPKPAVYDVNGWKPMPYLDQGEFYSEFGKFDINITLPENYVVAATGRLQNIEEKVWLTNRSKNRFTGQILSTEFPVSSSKKKTIRFIQDSIHDFAWFADKRFQVERSEVLLPKSSNKVTTWMFSVASKTSTVLLVDSAVLYYSSKIGEYPFTDVTVVETPLVSGAGMEYPMITNITKVNRQVIVHEVGHNWFYGILGSNERAYPWMDESINTYYETRSAETETIRTQKPITIKTVSNFGSDGYHGLESRYLINARRNNDQSVSLPSIEFTDANYGAIIYGKGATLFRYLQAYLGDDQFDNMMHAYYEKWKFKHPLSQDFIDHAQQFTGKDLSWFFGGLLSTKHKQDWKIKSIKKQDAWYQLSIKRKTPLNAPFSISGFKNDSVIKTIWFDSLGSSNVFFPLGDYDYLRIDAFEQSIDIDRSNNSINTNGIFKKGNPIQFRFWGDGENPYKNQLFFTPIVGTNLYNKLMIGGAFYNSLLPNKKVEYLIAPMYSIGINNLSGSAEVQKHFFSYGFLKRVTLESKIAQFAYKEFLKLSTYTKFQCGFNLSLTPKHFRTSPVNAIYGSLILVNERTNGASFLTGNNYTYTDLGFSSAQQRVINPFNYIVNYQLGNTTSMFNKLTVAFTQFINYEKPKKGLTARFFGGAFLSNYKSSTGRELFRAGNNTGIYDYTFDQSQFGRGENSLVSNSLFGQQLLFGELEFKELYPFVVTNKWATSLNVETTIPGILPIVLYADIAFINADEGYFDGNTATFVEQYNLKVLYTSGLSIKLLKDIFRVNIPLIASAEITDYFGGNNPGNVTGGKRYTERITFSLNLNKLNPIKTIRSLTF